MRNNISAREVLEAVFDNFRIKPRSKTICLPSPAVAEIENDSDWHRTRVGYIEYEQAIISKTFGRQWAIAFGTKRGGYPGGKYDCDIAAVPISEEKSEEVTVGEIYSALENNSRFRNSLIYAMSDGRLAVPKGGRFSQKVFELLQPRVQEFITQELKTDSLSLTMDFRPIVKSAVRYQRELVVFLSEALEVALLAS